MPAEPHRMAEAGPSDAAGTGNSAAAALPHAGAEADRDRARLVAAERQFQQGVQAIKDNRMEDAVDLFGKCLETRVAIHGGQAAECGSAYYRYGAALFYKAQDEADVFGGNLQDAAEKHDAQDDDHEPLAGEAAGPSGAGPSSSGAAGGPSSDIAGPSSGDAAGPSNGDVEGLLDGASAEQGSEPASEETDMQLAWNMLEVAKLIFSRDRDANALDLADVHMLLGDLSAENDAFDDALEEYRTALQLLNNDLPKDELPPVRRLAELHYKASLALQFSHKAEPARQHTETAIGLIKDRLAVLEARNPPAAAASTAASAPTAGQPAAAGVAADTAAAPAGGGAAAAAPPPEMAAPADAAAAAASPLFGAAAGGAAEAAAPPADVGVADAAQPAAATDAATSGGKGPKESKDEKEMEALRDSLKGLQDRLSELQEAIAEELATRQQLRAAFASIAGGGAAPAAAASGAPAAAAAAEPAAGGSSGAAAAAAPARPSVAVAPVRDLGVVGRGQKRITLAPVAAATATGAATASANGAPAPAKRRRLDDLMGGDGGEAATGFGSAPAAAAQPQQPAGAGAPAAAAPPSAMSTAAPAAADLQAADKKDAAPAAANDAQPPDRGAASAAEPGAAALPAFLRPEAVAATYGGGGGGGAGDGGSKGADAANRGPGA